jgi:hypothetical protein
MASDADDFERRVGEIFRALGAEVTHDVLLGGHQIDLLVTETTTAGIRLVTAVECKHWAKAPGVQAVTAFAEVVRDLRSVGLVNSAAMVSPPGFTRMAKDVAARNGIQLFEIDDLLTRRDLDLATASDVAGRAVTAARRLRGLLQDALAVPDGLTAFDWEDLHAELGKSLAEIRDSHELRRRTADNLSLERRARAAVTGVEEEAERCLDAVWYLRRVARLVEEADEQQSAVPGGETDRTSAAFVRLRELDQARGQLRQRVRRLAEVCARVERGR